MVLAILQFDLHVRGSQSLKDKRRVVNSVKDRLHHEHMVSVAEVGALESMTVARMGLSLVTNDVKYAAQVLDRIMVKLRGLHDAELGDARREILEGKGSEGFEDAVDPATRIGHAMDAELMDYAADLNADEGKKAS